ncbi:MULTISPECIES: hypothetical protein [unclassified Nonomuraea]|uniref:hypothetical protein n=1 Tax=unclassified Nonomuraea TaxID=2593643 RepID=UPI0033DAA72F
MLRLACLALVAVLTAGCTVADTGQPVAPEETEEVIEDEPDGGSDAAARDESARIAVCVDTGTQTRADYRPCEDERRGYAWYFYAGDDIVPAVGKRADGGTYEDPGGDELTKASPQGGPGAEAAIETPSEWVEVCVRKPSRQRVVNNFCEDRQAGYGWYYVAIDGRVPPVGERADNGAFRFYGGDSYRARESGGDAADAAIGYEETAEE